MKKIVFITGALSGSLLMLGHLFRVEHWTFGGELQILGYSLCSIIFFPCLAKYLYDQKK
jgi:hypothetical protein